MWFYLCQFTSFIISYPGIIRTALCHILFPSLSPYNANGKLTSWSVFWPVATSMNPLLPFGPMLGMSRKQYFYGFL